MKTITHYQCETCNTEYKSKSDAEACEKFHIVLRTIALKKSKYNPYNIQGASPYPRAISVIFEDGKEIEYKRG